MTEQNVIEEAHKTVERLEKANAEMRELLKKQEAMQAQAIISGRSSAGTPPPPPMSDDEKLKLEMKEFFKGTAVEGALK